MSTALIRIKCMAEPYEKTWHYPRSELSKSYLYTLKTGPQSLAIFAERKKVICGVRDADLRR
jgi:hypothetical protein